jgi:GT2 family glycosyltransferase
MPIFQRWDYVSRALLALKDNTDVPFEVVIVDNASNDGTSERLSSDIRGARIVRNEANYGFGAACNQGAALARAPVTVFLNSDAFVHPDWVHPLLEAIDGEVAAAGPMLLNLDGTVQEAGQCVTRIGQTVAYGGGTDPRSDAVRFARVVDYVSGACLAVRRAVFDAVGGFDGAYGLGYFEDVDLCFELKRRGLLTLYEPRSRVTHAHGGSTHGDVATRNAEQNRLTFLGRWEATLAGRPYVPRADGAVGLALRDAACSDRVLVITSASPAPPLELAVLRQLAETWPAARVTALGSNREAEREALLGHGIEVAPLNGDAEQWAIERLFHYDVVIARNDALPAETASLLHRTQPQAEWIDTASLEHASLIEVLASAGVAPPRWDANA